MSAAKDCPFCGAQTLEHRSVSCSVFGVEGKTERYYMACRFCDAQGPTTTDKTKIVAVALWNMAPRGKHGRG